MVVDLGDFPIQGCFLFLIVIINHGKIRKRAFPKEEVLVFFYFEVSFYGSIIFVVGKSPMDIMEPILCRKKVP